MTEVLESIAEHWTAALGSTLTRAGEIVRLPLDFADGDVVTVLVQRLDDDRYFVTDSGEAAARLALSDLDFSRAGVARAWSEIRKSVLMAPAIMAPLSDEFELATSCDRAELGRAAAAIGAAMVRSEGLAVLAPNYRPRTFAAHVVRRVADFELTVIPEAEMPARFGGSRRVTCEIKGIEREVFTQALSSAGDRTRAYDHVRSLFIDAALELEQEQKVVVVQRGLRLLGWQREALRQDNLVVDESDLDDYLGSLVA